MKRPLLCLPILLVVAGCSKDSETGLPRDLLPKVSAEIKDALKEAKKLEPQLQEKIKKCDDALKFIDDAIKDVQKRNGSGDAISKLMTERNGVESHRSSLIGQLHELQNSLDVLRSRIVASAAIKDDPKVKEAFGDVLERINGSREALKRADER